MPEEAYEVRYDPDALTNLIAKPENAAQVATREKALEDWMVKTNDSLLEVFRKRDDAAFREQYMKQLEGKQTSAQDRKVANKALSAAKPTEALITLEAPKNIVRGQKAVLKVKHTLSADRYAAPENEMGPKSCEMGLGSAKPPTQAHAADGRDPALVGVGINSGRLDPVGRGPAREGHVALVVCGPS